MTSPAPHRERIYCRTFDTDDEETDTASDTSSRFSRRLSSRGSFSIFRPPPVAPARHHGLTALSPLQTFSPLDPTAPRSPSRTHSRTSSYQGPTNLSTGTHLAPHGALGLGISPRDSSFQGFAASGWNRPVERTGSPASLRSAQPGNESRASPGPGNSDDESTTTKARTQSVTPALSRRESIVASMSMMAEMSAGDRKGSSPSSQSPVGSVSRITLVRAPSKGKADDKASGDPRASVRRRAKSSAGGSSPFTLIASSLPDDSALESSPATDYSSLPRGAAKMGSSFSLSGPRGPASPGGVGGTPGSRTSFLFNQQLGEFGDRNPLNIQERPRALRPEEVVILAESLKSPSLADDDGRPKSLSRNGSLRDASGLRRSKSGGSFTYRSAGQAGSSASPAERERQDAEVKEKDLALEPVEYVEMNDEVLLPYVDRPTEVAELIQQVPNIDFFNIIQPSFPSQSSTGSSNPDAWKQISPAKWTWEEFQKHLLLPRGECDDFEWIRRARLAVRARSEAMWEKIGMCLGCDEDLINAGEEYEVFEAGGALGDDYNADDIIRTPQGSHQYGLFDADEHDEPEQVVVEGLEPADDSDQESGLGVSLNSNTWMNRASSPLPGAAGAMETIGEGDEELSAQGSAHLTPAQRAGGRGEAKDPMGTSYERPMSLAGVGTPGSPGSIRSSRSKSFVGLQISTAPSKAAPPYRHIRSRSTVFSTPVYHPSMERGPGSPLFPSSFSQLSLAPTLPSNNPDLKAAAARLSFSAGPRSFGTGGGFDSQRAPWTDLHRRKSGSSWSRLSESALTFGSEDD